MPGTDSLSGWAIGSEWPTQELVPKIPTMKDTCPKLAKIDPEGVAVFDAEMEKWRKQFLVRLTGGAKPS